MERRVLVLLACFAVVQMLMIGLGRTEAAITCGKVVTALTPCVNYARFGGTVPIGCCSGCSQLIAAAKALPDLQAACRCIKTIAASVPGVQYNLLSGIPEKCGLSLPFTISPSIDCSKVHW